MDIADVECIIAAILTRSGKGSDARNIVNEYVDMLEAVRKAGGHREPKKDLRTVKVSDEALSRSATVASKLT